MSRSILITGASRGLGLCLAELYAEAEWKVFAGCRGPAPDLRALADKHPHRVFPISLDVTNRDVLFAARDAVTEQSSSLDALINNAAILPEIGRGPIETMNIEIGLELFDVNSLGPLRVTQTFLPLLRGGERRLIVNVSSEAGSVGECWRKDEYLYCMSKAALNMQTAILKNHLSPEGFEVFAVHPGWMRTEMGGPNADIPPGVAAAGIFALSQTSRAPTDPFYMDYLGKTMKW